MRIWPWTVFDRRIELLQAFHMESIKVIVEAEERRYEDLKLQMNTLKETSK